MAHLKIDLANAKINEANGYFTREERDNFTKLLNCGFIDTFRELYPTKIRYSYWCVKMGSKRTNKGWRLDYFVCDQRIYNAVQDSLIRDDIHGSDHCPIELILNSDKL